MRQLGLDAVANLDDREIRCSLQHRSRHQIADAPREFLVNRLAAGGAHDVVDDALGVLRGDAAHVGGCDITFFELFVDLDRRVGFLVINLGWLANRHEFVNVDFA